MCMTCGHVGCCDSSPNRHATGHWVEHRDHPIIRSYEPGEDWWWCYEDDLAFEIDGAGPGDAARLTTAGPVLMRAGPDGVEVLIWATT
jgi:hypothetical protein